MTEKEGKNSKASVCTKTISTDNFFEIDIFFRLFNTNLHLFFINIKSYFVRTWDGKV